MRGAWHGHNGLGWGGEVKPGRTLGLVDLDNGQSDGMGDGVNRSL